jgi:hypothetical protein
VVYFGLLRLALPSPVPEAGVGKKLEPEPAGMLDLEDLDPKTLAPKEGKSTRESIVKTVRTAATQAA